MMIVNDDSRVINKLETSLTDDALVVIYECHMLIVRATGLIVVDNAKNSGPEANPRGGHLKSAQFG
jgi:hypothetical protein